MYCNKCGKKIEDGEQFCSQCNNVIKNEEQLGKQCDNKKKAKSKVNILIIGMLLIVIGSVGIIIFEQITKVEMPNLIGKTVEQAREITEELDLKIANANTSSDNSIIVSQSPQYRADYKIKKGTSFSIITKTPEQIEEEEKEKQRQQEKVAKIKQIIQEWAKNVEDVNKGSVSYRSHNKYATTDEGKEIYMIIYDTSSKYTKYRQLVALDEDLTTVKGTTKLYTFTYLSDGSEGSNQEKEMKWEARQKWGID